MPWIRRPDLKPIEQLFAKLKALLRNSEESRVHRQAPLQVSIKSPDPNVLHTSQFKDVVNLNRTTL